MRSAKEITDIYLDNNIVFGPIGMKAFLGLEEKYKEKADYADLELSSSVIRDAIEKKIPIVSVNDLDVDGATAGAIANIFFTKVVGYDETNFRVVLNNRRNERGVSDDLLPEVYKAVDSIGAGLIITADHGSDNMLSFKKIKERYPEMKIVVTDHHLIHSDVKKHADAFVNPNRPENVDKDPISGCAVLYMVLYDILHELGTEDVIDDIKSKVALTTICDMVPLNCIMNRKLYKAGTKGMEKSLMFKDITDDEETMFKVKVDEKLYGWTIGPLLNSSHRQTDEATRAYNWLSATSEKKSTSAYHVLKVLNSTRRKAQANAFEQAKAYIDENPQSLKTPLVAVIDSIYSGVAGIVAQKIGELFNVPAIILTYNESRDAYGGSARSVIRGYSLFSVVKIINTLHYGILPVPPRGHDGAFGCTVNSNKLEEFKVLLSKYSKITDEMTSPTYGLHVIDVIPEEITKELKEEIAKYSPFGKEWELPIFRTKSRIRRTNSRYGKTIINIDHAVEMVYTGEFDDIAELNGELVFIFTIDIYNTNGVKCTIINIEEDR